MSNKPILVLVVVAAVVALFWLLGGVDLLGGGGDADRTDGGSESASLLDEGRTAEDLANAAEQKRTGPGLFGRKREDLVGHGGLRGLVRNFKTGLALEGATLVVVGTGYGDEKVSEQVTSGGDGRFELAGIAAGDRYQLHVRGPGQLQRSYPSVSVDAGGERDLGTIWLGQSGVLEGVVVDGADKPVASADVQIHAGGGSLLEVARNFTKLFEQLHKDAEPLQAVKTDARGRFRVEKLDPGPITVVVRATAHQQAVQNEVMTSQGAAGGTVRVRLQPCDVLVGTVVDEHGRGIADAGVACLNKDDMSSVLFGRHFEVTDGDGRFVIDSPPAGGNFAMIVTADGYPTLFTEAKAGSEALRLELQAGVEVLLRVLEKGTDRPVEGAKLTGMFSSEKGFSGKNMDIASTATDDRGEATVLVREGKLQMLWMNHPEKGTGVYSPMMGSMGASGILTGPDDVTVKKPRTTLVFHVQAGVAIRGKVADEEGNPVGGARVMATGTMGMGGTAVADEDGVYELLGQSTPLTAVLATAPGYVQMLEGFSGVPSEPGQDVTYDIVMQRAATVTGRVVDAKGAPLSGVRVKVSGGGAGAMLKMFTGENAEGITNREGRYLLSGVSPDKKGRAVGRLAGLLDSASEKFEIKAGQANEAPDLVMRAGARLKVSVRDPDGATVHGARVEVSVQAMEQVKWDVMGSMRGFADLTTRAAGTVDVPDLPDGTVTITASKKGWAANRLVLIVKGGEAVGGAPVIPLREPFTLRGRVVDAEGKGAAKVEVDCNPIRYGRGGGPEEPWAPNGSATTGPDGRFEISDMPDMPMKLKLSGEGYQKLSHTLPGPRGEAEIRVARMNAGVAARLEELQKELMQVYQQFAAAKTEEEKAAVLGRMQQLQKENAALDAGQSLDDAKAAGESEDVEAEK